MIKKNSISHKENADKLLNEAYILLKLAKDNNYNDFIYKNYIIKSIIMDDIDVHKLCLNKNGKDIEYPMQLQQ